MPLLRRASRASSFGSCANRPSGSRIRLSLTARATSWRSAASADLTTGRSGRLGSSTGSPTRLTLTKCSPRHCDRRAAAERPPAPDRCRFREAPNRFGLLAFHTPHVWAWKAPFAHACEPWRNNAFPNLERLTFNERFETVFLRLRQVG